MHDSKNLWNYMSELRLYLNCRFLFSINKLYLYTFKDGEADGTNAGCSNVTGNKNDVVSKRRFNIETKCRGSF